MKNNAIAARFPYYLLITCLLLMTSCNKSEREKEALLKSNDIIKKRIGEMAIKYNSSIDWFKAVEEQSLLQEQIFTMNLQDALVKKDEQPVLLYGIVQDISRKGNGYIVDFLSYFYSPLEIHYSLECNDYHVEKIVKQKQNMFDNYACVAKITSVSKQKFQMSSSDIYDENTSDDIIIETNDNIRLEGICMDILFLGEYAPETMSD